MTAAKKAAPRPYRSGFCGRNNPKKSHDHCPKEYQGRPCICDCHEPTNEGAAAPAPEKGAAGTISGSQVPAAHPDALPLGQQDVGFFPNIPEQDYHAHAGSLSQSGAKLILKAPALFRHEQQHPTFKKVWEFGKAAHAEVLGVGSEIVVHQFDPEKVKSPKATNAWKAELADTQKRGAVLLLPAEMQQVREMADKLSEHTLAMRLLSDGASEVSAFALDEATGVLRRGRMDWLGPTILTDYKTSTTADPRAFARSACDFGYDVQAAWYLDLAEQLGHPAEAFAFIVQMKEPPYLVEVVELDEASVERGRRRYRRALQIFAECTSTGVWPGYQQPDTFTTVRVPDWALREEGVI